MAGADPGERWLALSKIEDSCSNAAGTWELSSNCYPGTVYPKGRENVWAFKTLPFPCYILKTGHHFLEREIMMAKGHRGVFVVYRLSPSPSAMRRGMQGGMQGESLTLQLRPLCNYRFYHHTAREGSWTPKFYPLDGALVLQGHTPCREILLACPGSSFSLEPRWYHNMIYRTERERGLDDREDHLNPGCFTVRLEPGGQVVFWAGPLPEGTVSSFVSGLSEHYEEMRLKELNRRRSIAEKGQTKLIGRLFLAGDQFVVTGPSGASIIAGYHWFGEWGRDTFISLPGLLLCTGRFGEAQEVFLRFAEALESGLIPNRFVEGCGAAYNSADASLWMIDALRKYEKATEDFAFVKSFLPYVREVVESYMAGTDFGTGMDSRSLLRTGTRESQVTWMDACAHGTPVTPRWGYPVEINGLWVHALACISHWEKKAGSERYNRYSGVYKKAASEFLKAFTWRGNGLYDRVDESGPVEEIRPNQLIAAGCDGLNVPDSTLYDILRTSCHRLLTPRGLRTLDPGSPSYRGRYKGPPFERDSAYHQGTAWPWLLGPFFDVMGKLDRKSAAALRLNTAKTWRYLLGTLVDLDRNPCAGSVFEVASGDAPFEPGGAVAQAWSVAETIRILCSAGPEHINGKRRLT